MSLPNQLTIFPSPPVEVRDDIACFHPGSAGKDYPERDFELLRSIEDGHFWFESRNLVLEHLVRKFLLGDGSAKTFLEIGCGTGFVLRMLAKMENLRVAGAEIHLTGARLAAGRVEGAAEVVQLDALRMTFETAFDAVGVFDVIEHLDEDVEVLRRIGDALKPGGFCFVSVPQHARLWSPQDDMAGHKRRYSRKMLLQRLKEADLETVYITSFCFAVMPLFIVSRLRKQRLSRAEAEEHLMSEVTLSPRINRMLKAMLQIDLMCIRSGLSLPWGGSLVAVARRPR